LYIFYLCRAIYWAEAGVIKSSQDDGSDVRVVVEDLGNITAVDISQGNVNVVITPAREINIGGISPIGIRVVLGK